MSDVVVDAAQAVLDDFAAHRAAAPLKSIFSLIPPSREDPTAQSPPVFFKPRRLRFAAETLFPVAESELAADVADQVEQLLAEYRQALAGRSADPAIRLEQTLALLQEYAWALPSTTPGVALYDALRTEAALAAATASTGADSVLLLGGDLSGIQDFIYTLAADQATKSLRSRSLYLQLLTDAVARWLLALTGMPLTNLLYSGGGRFYVIVPYSADWPAQLHAWRRELSRFLLHAHQGELYVALGACALAVENPDLKAVWRSVNESISADKRRRFAALDADELHQLVFAPRGHGGNADAACAVCNYMGALEAIDTGDDEPLRVCALCASFINNHDGMSSELRDAAFICTRFHTPSLDIPNARQAWHQVLRALGMSVWFRPAEQDVAGSDLARRLKDAPAERVAVISDAGLQQLDVLRRAFPQHVFSIRPVVNVLPMETDAKGRQRIKTFHDLAQQPAHPTSAQQSAAAAGGKGFERYGVLRMDVDDLGDLFTAQSGTQDLAGIASMSAALARFFEGWVGTICREFNADSDPARNNALYTVYSGGDDLFIVGAWHVLPQVALRISADLGQYACNPRVHLSGGLSLHSAKFPLYQAAKAAEEEVERAKGIDSGKAAFSFLEQTVKWAFMGDFSNPDALSVWGLVQRIDAQLQPATSEHGDTTPRLNQAFLQTLQQLYVQYAESMGRFRNQQQAPQWLLGPWVWRGAYQLKRIEQRIRTGDNDAAEALASKALINTIRTSLTDGIKHNNQWTGERMIERLGLAARWTQLLNRKQQKKER